MKKGIIGLVIAIVTMLCSVAYATEGNALPISYITSTDSRIIAVAQNANGYDMILAGYDENGRLVSKKHTKVDDSIEIMEDNLAEDITYKAFLWNTKILKPAAKEAKYEHGNSVSMCGAVEFDCEYIESVRETQIRVYKDDYTTETISYRISENVMILVNGVALEVFGYDELESYLNSGVVRLLDIPRYGTDITDGKYDLIMIDYYATGVVDEVYNDGDVTEIVIAYSYDSDLEEIVVDKESDVTYSFKDTNGNDILPEDIPVGAVVSVAYNVNEGCECSDFYDVIVSTNVVQGVVYEAYCDYNGKEKFVLNGKAYEWADVIQEQIELGEEYILYLDKDGKIAMREIVQRVDDYAIVERYYTSAGDDKVRLRHMNGTVGDYIIEEDWSDAWSYQGTLMNTMYEYGEEGLMSRFVKYRLTPRGDIILEPVPWAECRHDSCAIYNESEKRIGSYAINESTVLIDASEFAFNLTKNIQRADIEIFKDSLDYDVIALGKRDYRTGAYPVIVVLNKAYGYNIYTSMAIVNSGVSQVVIDGYVMDKVGITDASGEEKYIYADCGDMLELREGDAIIYYEDADGWIADYYLLYSVECEKNTLKNSGDIESYMFGAIDTGWIEFNGDKGDTIRFEFYPIISVTDKGVRLATDASVDPSMVSGLGDEYEFADDVVCYEYNGTYRRNFVHSLESPLAITSSTIRNAAKDLDRGTIDLTYSDNKLAYALVRLYDGEIKELYNIYFD